MDPIKSVSVKFVLNYLKYLSNWNDSASLLHVISWVEASKGEFTQETLEEWIQIAQFEYIETKSSTSDTIMSMSDILLMVNREK